MHILEFMVLGVANILFLKLDFCFLKITGIRSYGRIPKLLCLFNCIFLIVYVKTETWVICCDATSVRRL
jgi:hypothetical protein